MSCNADDDDKTRLGGGMALKSPFGTFYAPNISSDAKDGIGGWSEANFVNAMVKGTSPDGRHYYPVFPYTSYQRMKMEDVRDLFAYIKTVAGGARQGPRPRSARAFQMAPPARRLEIAVPRRPPFKPDASKPEAWNRAPYLVNAPAHCAECHSPRNVLGRHYRVTAFCRRS